MNQNPEYLRRPDAARFCGVSTALFAKLDRTAGGPKRILLGRAVVYSVQDLRAWMESRRAA
jgi:predicted DNA-binding transcriptional regulator AlpA